LLLLLLSYLFLSIKLRAGSRNLSLPTSTFLDTNKLSFFIKKKMNTTTTRKRTHLKPSQVTVLQESFNNNPLPDSSVRSRLARELDVTERTIQIWFQNRRAKARKSEALSSFTTTNTPSLIAPMDRHHTPPRYQATFRTMMTPERFEELKQDSHQIRKRPRSSSKPEKSSHLLDIVRAHENTRAMSEGHHEGI
jgi:hypothetical protein